MSSKGKALFMSIFTYLLAGYLAGLVIGFTVFDPDSDVWALLGALLALVGMMLGLLPIFRRNVPVVLTAIIGFYVGMLLSMALTNSSGMLDSLESTGGTLMILTGTIFGAGIGIRSHPERLCLPLVAFVFGGFMTPLIVGVLFALKVSDASLAPLVIISGLLSGGLVLRFAHQNKE